MAYILKALSRVSRLTPRHMRTNTSSTSSLVYSEEVLQAKMEDKPIVALESTIITHGMPYPQNLETAVEVENIIREQGAIPATVAILKGQLTVGLSEQQLSYLSQAQGVVKASRRDLAPVLAAKKDGATTVAGTLIAAGLADIPVFVTGGIGGVHREGETTLDMSADLTELGRSSTMVVCSGVKSILDIGRTLEYLETQGVCVCAFGETDDFPAFYTVRSGHRAPYHVQNAQEAAKLLHASRTIRLASGIVVAVPVPKEYAMDENKIDVAIEGALKEAKARDIRGKEVTPFILAAVARATEGASLDANIALIKNNAKVSADIAVEFKKLRNLENSSNIGVSGGGILSGTFKRQFHTSYRDCVATRDTDGDDAMFGPHMRSDGNVLVIGGANVDRTYRITEDNVHLDGSTHACNTRVSSGGVGRNVAEALWRLRGGRSRLIAALGDDADGRYLADATPGMILDGSVIPGAQTASYAAVLDSRGECRLGLGDMSVHDHISKQMVNKHKEVLGKAPLVVIDGNVPQATVDHVLQLCREQRTPVFFEPTDRRKAAKVLHSKQTITYASPNLSELQTMAYFIRPNLNLTGTSEMDKLIQLSEIVMEALQILIVTLGAKGVLIVRRTNKTRKYRASLYPVEILSSVKNVSGAGDCFVSGFMHGVLAGLKEGQCVSLGFSSAKLSLLSDRNVPTNLKAPANITEAKFETIL